MGKLPFENISRKIIIKRDVKTNENFEKRPEDRTINELINYGIINLNKASGPSSHQITDYVKKILNVSKAGHSGTLDPKVVGVLPIALEKATRIVQVLLTSGKEYVCLMYLHKKISEKEIKNIFEEFSGEIKQIPPVRSAVKRQERKRNIYYIEILEIDDQYILFRVGCQAGTYIRKLVDQIGKKIGCGAHMVQLIRTKAGPFNDNEMYTLHDLKDAYEFYKEGSEKGIRKIILPFERAVDHLGKVWVVDGCVDALCHGAPLYIVGISKLTENINKNDIVAVLTLKNELICIGQAEIDSDEMVKLEKGVAVDKIKVFMERGTYRKTV